VPEGDEVNAALDRGATRSGSAALKQRSERGEHAGPVIEVAGGMLVGT